MSSVLSKLGIGKPMDYMMFFQSILVIVATLFTLHTLGSSLLSSNFVIYSHTASAGFMNCFDGLSQIIYVIIALMLLFYSFNLSYKGKDNYYGLIMAVYAICIFRFALFQPLLINILGVIELICVIVFIYLVVNEDFKKSKKLMTVILVLVIICNLLTSFIGGALVPTFEVVIVQISVAFTFFVRVLRNRCPEIAM